MAERRMFAKSIIGSARFLRMPPSSRLLYYDLGMYADDDGVVEAFSVMRQTGSTEDDLRVLVTKGFVTVLNEDLVSLITDWNTNNFIRSDRYHPSIYKDLVLRLTDGIPTDNQRYTEDSIGKDSLDKVSIGKVSNKRFIKPTIEDLEDYINEKGYQVDAHKFYNYYESNGWKVGRNPMKDWKAAIRNWAHNGYNNSNQQSSGNPFLDMLQKGNY